MRELIVSVVSVGFALVIRRSVVLKGGNATVAGNTISRCCSAKP